MTNKQGERRRERDVVESTSVSRSGFNGDGGVEGDGEQRVQDGRQLSASLVDMNFHLLG